MKAIKIASKVALNNGLSTVSGAIVVITQALANPEQVKDGLIPCQIITKLYASLTAYTDKKACVDQIADFNPSFLGLTISVEGWETVSSQDAAIATVQQYLETIYPGKITIINI